MSTENEILDSKINASANINNPTYPGPHGKMFICNRNLTLYLAQTKPPKAVYDSVSFGASEVLTCPFVKAVDLRLPLPPHRLSLTFCISSV
jgi:hypothetical protein